MAYIDTIDYNQSTGRLKEIYDELIHQRGKLAEVHKIQSLHSETILTHMNLYMSIMFSRSPLSSQQREMMAVIVSLTNQCNYCIRHHCEALNFYWKNEERIHQLCKKYEDLDISTADKLLCDYAVLLTKTPQNILNDAHLLALKNAGMDDRSILDASLVIAYFNFVNRMVIGLGVELESDSGSGYNY